MKLELNSKLLFWLVIVFAFVNLVDVITAMHILPGEANPIYLLTQSKIVLWVLKLFFIGLIFYIYFKNQYPSRFWYFSFVYLMVIGTLVVSLGAVSNIYGMNNPEQIEEASQLSNAQKMSYYGTLIGITMVIPYIISMIAFKIYDVTEKNIIYKNGKKSIDSNNGGTIRN